MQNTSEKSFTYLGIIATSRISNKAQRTIKERHNLETEDYTHLVIEKYSNNKDSQIDYDIVLSKEPFDECTGIALKTVSDYDSAVEFIKELQVCSIDLID